MLVTPKGIRRNNPLNLMRTHPRQGWEGALSDDAIDDDREEAFTDPLWGLRAAGIVLLNDELRHGLWTPREIYSRFAPPNENNTDAYIDFMASALGVGVDDRIDFRQGDNLFVALKSGTRLEDGQQPYDDTLIRQAAGAALRAVGVTQST